MIKKVLLGILSIVVAMVVAFGVMIGILTVSEYKPKPVENIEIEKSKEGKSPVKSIAKGDRARIMLWNVGYGALGESADFFMDGGKSVMTDSKEQTSENLKAIGETIKKENPDITMLQEVDRDSKRSHHINEYEIFLKQGIGNYNTFALNYKVLYTPYPWPPLGKIDAGIMTTSKFEVTESKRIALPVPFKWPVRIANLKRGLMVNRIPVKETDKELVVVNLHLEAYDDGDGKKAQTAKLLKVINDEQKKGNYVIAGGDFNQSFSNVDAGKYVKDYDLWLPGVVEVSEFGDSWQMLMDDSKPSCRSLDKAYKGEDKDKFQFYIIDGYIVSKNINVEKIETKNLEFVNSDHNPVVMDFKLN